MRYDEFLQTWHAALRESQLPPVGPPPEQQLDLDRMNRTYRVYLHSIADRSIEPFHTCLTLEWGWDALQAARTASTEEDMLTSLYGRDERHLDTERPWIRVNATLSASLEYGKSIPFPKQQQWTRWLATVREKLDGLLHSDMPAPGDEIVLPVSHCGDPTAKIEFDRKCLPHLHAVKLAAFQEITLPRQWDDPDREDPDPRNQLTEFFDRLAKAFGEWKKALPLLVDSKS